MIEQRRHLPPQGPPSRAARAVAGLRAALALGVIVGLYCGTVAGWRLGCAIAGATWREG